MSNKKQLGQFLTTNADYILQGFEGLVRGKNICDPFAGSGDLLKWAKKNGANSFCGFDIDSESIGRNNINFRDSLLDPPKADFIATNPPYLNINKADLKIKTKYFEQGGFEDLYQYSLRSIMNSREGVVIVPVNFLSADNASKIRNLFFSKFRITSANYFRQPVFDDTTYNVISFHYERISDVNINNEFSFNLKIFPQNIFMPIVLRKRFNWAFGGEYMEEVISTPDYLGVSRLQERHLEGGDVLLSAAFGHIDDVRQYMVSQNTAELMSNNIIFLKAIDSGTPEGRIKLEDLRTYNLQGLVSKESSRHMIQIIFNKYIPITVQQQIISEFNSELSGARDKYLSLFLTNYRDKDRKRISFEFAYKLINKIYAKILPTKTSGIFHSPVLINE